jgi:hypothetical protein
MSAINTKYSAVLCVCACVCMCVHIYIYVYIYTHIQGVPGGCARLREGVPYGKAY